MMYMISLTNPTALLHYINMTGSQLRHSSGSYSSASHHGGPRLIPGQVMQDDKVALGQVISEYFSFPLPILITPIAPYSLIITS
jgi:hypothetical protein